MNFICILYFFFSLSNVHSNVGIDRTHFTYGLDVIMADDSIHTILLKVDIEVNQESRTKLEQIYGKGFLETMIIPTITAETRDVAIQFASSELVFSNYERIEQNIISDLKSIFEYVSLLDLNIVLSSHSQIDTFFKQHFNEKSYWYEMTQQDELEMIEYQKNVVERIYHLDSSEKFKILEIVKSTVSNQELREFIDDKLR